IKLKQDVERLTAQFLEQDKNNDPKAGDTLKEIRSTFTQLREAMSRARGEDKQLTQHRKTMEEKIGAKAGPAGGAACLEAMGQQALTMVAEAESPVKAGAASLDDRLKAIPEDMKATIGGQVGTALTKGFAGVVGTSFDAIKQALAEGSIN